MSAVELLQGMDLGSAEPDDLVEHLIKVAMTDLQPYVDGALAWSFAVYSARLVAAVGSQRFFDDLGYSNSDRAQARSVWAEELPRLHLTALNSSADFEVAFTQAYRDLPYRSREMSIQRKPSRRFIDFLGSSLDLFESAEQSIVREGVRYIDDALKVTGVGLFTNVPEVRALDDEIISLMSEIQVSGSLLLQETVFLGLRSARAWLAEQLETVSLASRPNLTVELVSVKLPMSARTTSPFRLRFRVRNVGNSSALQGWLRVSSEGLAFDVPTESVADLASMEECEISFAATTVAPTSTVSISAVLSWSDVMGQDFSSDEATFLAEDQRASSWTADAANPYSLSSIADSNRLVGRVTETASLEGILRMSDSTYVTGLKRVGKSSLVSTILETLHREQSWAISRLELGQMLGDSRTPAAIALGIIDGISEALDYAGIEVLEINLTGDQKDYARVVGKWLRALERSTPDLAKLHVVVAIDDFDGIPSDFVEGESGSGLFLFLRSLVDKPWLSLIFIGSEIMPSVIASQGYQLNQVRRTPLDHFQSKEDTEQLLRTPTLEQLEWSDESIAYTHQLSNGNPYYSTLIAQRVWDQLRKLDRTLVDQSDITDAVSYIAQNQDSITFSHMWADDPSGMAPKSRRSMLAAAILLSAARCSPTVTSGARKDEVLTIAQSLAGEATVDELNVMLHRLLTRDIMTRDEESQSVSIRVPLLSEWLRSKGRRELEGEFEQFTRQGGANRVIAAGDWVSLGRNLNYAGREISDLQLKAWVEQFSDDARDHHLIFLLLQRLVKEGYFSTSKIYQTILPRLRDQVRSVVPELEAGRQNFLRNVLIASHGIEGSSVPAMVSHFRQVLRVKKENCIPVSDVPAKLMSIERPIIVMADDFAGTGRQLSRAMESLCQELDGHGDWRESTVLVAATAISAAAKLTPCPSFDGADIRVAVGHHVPIRLHAFHPEANIFDSEDDRIRAKDLVTVIGKNIGSRQSLGYGQLELLVLLESNCPNNTLPIFWKHGRYAGKDWDPIFPRAT